MSSKSSGVTHCLFCTAITTPVQIASSTISLMILISNGIIKSFLKIMGKKDINMEK